MRCTVFKFNIILKGPVGAQGPKGPTGDPGQAVSSWILCWLAMLNNVFLS